MDIKSIIRAKLRTLFKICSGCTILYRTNWYKNFFVDTEHEIYPDNVWYRRHDERNFDVVNLGSSGGKWAFDYDDTGLKGMNWAYQPQTLYEDYQLLRHYHSILKKNGVVIITIMPFTGLNKKTWIFDAMKYLKLETQGEPIQPYMAAKAQRLAEYPILFRKPAVKALIKYFLGKDKPRDYSVQNAEHNQMTVQQLKNDASMWINGWKNQFSIIDFDAPLTEENQKGRDYRIRLMRDLVDFCLERGYKPVYVIPPVTEYLDHYFTPKFKQTYYYEFLKQVERDVLLLDYTADKSLMDSDLYFNSFFFNKRGRKIFTKRVLKDIGII